VDKIVEYIKNRKWNNILRTHLNAVEQNLPYSLTHFFLYHLYYILSNDAQAQDVILDILSAKEYWQVDLQNRPWRNGTAVFNLKKSDKTELTFSPTRGKIDDIRSSHAKLNYILK
jgi:Ni,Fe-hydrogenase I cytochrome b subunit